MRKFLYLILILVLLFPHLVLAADVEEPFTGYSASLEGENGGTGWGNAWQDGPRTADFQVETIACDSGDCVEADATTSDYGDDRDYTTAIVNGTISFKANQVVDNSTMEILFKKTDDTALFEIAFIRNGSPSNASKVLLIAGTNATLGDTALATWQLVEIETEAAGTCAANEVRARLDGGTWSSCLAYSNTGDVQQLEILRDYSGAAGGISQFDTFLSSVFVATTGAVIRPAPLWTKMRF